MQKVDVSEGEALSNLKKNLESNVDLSLDKEYSRRDSDEARIGQLAEAEDKAKDSGLFQFQRRVQKTSPRQAQVFESQLADGAMGEVDELRRTNRVEGRESAAEAYQVPGAESGLISGIDSDSQEGAEIDPFVAYTVGDEWLVFERKVWWQDRRYIQGFVTQLGGFLGSFPSSATGKLSIA